MVNWNAAKLAVLVAVGLVGFLLVGAALRFASRILSFVLLALLVGVAAYAVYELYAGWTATEPGSGSMDEDVGSETRDVEDLRDSYIDGELSEAEFERELADVVAVSEGDTETSVPEPEKERS